VSDVGDVRDVRDVGVGWGGGMVWVVYDLSVGCEGDTYFEFDGSKEDVGSGVSQLHSSQSRGSTDLIGLYSRASLGCTAKPRHALPFALQFLARTGG
jgi:hypothetical protein